MDHIPPISPFGQPIYGTPLSPSHTVNLQHALFALSQTLGDDSYKDSDGKIDVDRLGGMVDVLLFFDIKLSDPAFHKDIIDPEFHDEVTKLCTQFEAFRKDSKPETLAAMQETVKLLGVKHPEISHNQYIDLISGLLAHIKDYLTSREKSMNNEIIPMLGQLTTLITLIAANPNINEKTKLEAHHLYTHTKEWMQGNLPKEALIQRVDQLTQDIRLLLR